jgi:hypothetical protein
MQTGTHGGRQVAVGTSAYLADRRSGYGAVEMLLIPTDPNATTFPTRVMAKVVSPC